MRQNEQRQCKNCKMPIYWKQRWVNGHITRRGYWCHQHNGDQMCSPTYAEPEE